MGIAIEAIGQIQRATGATVLVVHHTGKKAVKIERGSNALRGAAHVMIFQQKTANNHVALANDKQKDNAEFAPATLKLETIELDIKDEDNNPLTSCVLVPTAGSAVRSTIAPTLMNALRTLSTYPRHTATSAAWMASVRGRTGRVKERTFHNHREKLLNNGLIEQVSGVLHNYRVTKNGLAALKQEAATAN